MNDTGSLGHKIITVTAARQNCSLLWCRRSMRGVVVDPGGDLPLIRAAIAAVGLAVERLLVTHGHIDHCGEAGTLAAALGVPIEGPHVADRTLLARLAEWSAAHAMRGTPFEPDRWLQDHDQIRVGETMLDVLHCPGHTPGHVVFYHAASRLALVGDVLFRGSIGRSDIEGGSYPDLVRSITGKLWPLGSDTRFTPGHGPGSNFANERRDNPFVGDHELA